METIKIKILSLLSARRAGAVAIKKQFGWNYAATCVFYAIAFLLPIFFLPVVANAFSFGKAILFYGGVSAALIFFLFSRLQKGSVAIPKSGLLLAGGGIVLAWFISSVFSTSSPMSFFGAGYEVGTFSFFLFLGIALFLIASLFQSEIKIAIFYLSLFLSAALVFIFQTLHTIFGVTIFSSDIFNVATANLIGGWNDFAIFFGLIGLLSLCFFELADLRGKFIKPMFFAGVVGSVLAMFVVNFSAVWIVFGFFAIVFLVYLFSEMSYPEQDSLSETANVATGKFAKLTLVVILLSFFFIIASGLIGNFIAPLKTDFVEVSPSWGATFSVVKSSLGENLILGSGPNTFAYDWMKFKPTSVSSTKFANTRFDSGIGRLPSMVAETGLLGVAALLFFLVTLVFYGTKIFSLPATTDKFSKALVVASFMGSLYLWVFTIIYSPGFLIFALAFMLSGILIASLVYAGGLEVVEFSFLRSVKSRFISLLIIIFLMLGTVFGVYFFSKKFIAFNFYSRGIVEANANGDFIEAEKMFFKAINLDPRDQYFGALSELGSFGVRGILSQKEEPTDDTRAQFERALNFSIQNAQKAVEVNPADFANWARLAVNYEVAASVQVPGAKEYAIASYKKALELSPNDANILSRIEAIIQGAQARNDNN